MALGFLRRGLKELTLGSERTLREKYENQTDFIKALKNENQDALVYLDLIVFPQVLQANKKFQLPKEEMEDLFMLTLSSFLAKVKSEHIVLQENGTLIGYLMLEYRTRASKYLIKKSRRNLIEQKIAKEIDRTDQENAKVEKELFQKEEAKILQQELNSLKGECFNIIQLTYFNGLSDKEILENNLTKYNSIQSIRNKRARCMEVLRANISKNSYFSD